MRLEFTVNGQARSVRASPLARLVDILREDLRLTGTKEGCGEGECGTCAVLMDGDLVNACLVPAMQLAGRRITTIEGLGTEDQPDPLQRALREEGGVQCGFCTPGMVVAARALLDRCPQPSREEIRSAMAGNLCRCTGYGSIVRAIEHAAATQAREGDERADQDGCERSASGSGLGPRSTPEPGEDELPAYWPGDLAEAADILRVQGGSVTILAGATDLLTQVKLGLVGPTALMDITDIPELRGIRRRAEMIEIGAATTFASLASDPLVSAQFPALALAAAQLGAPPVQNRATLGGNLMSASPAADAPPVLMALDAQAQLASASGMRSVPVASFFTGYRETACRSDELLLRIGIPTQTERAHQAFYKVGTRRAQAISKVSLACRAVLDPDRSLRAVRLAAGSVAPTTIRLPQTEEFLEGRVLAAGTTEGLIRRAAERARQEVQPIDDVRSTAGYRRWVVGNLVARFLYDLLGKVQGA
jgi:carbon-monoxide dehydrogenase small subunit/xanthine dehydrogenase small subunit